MARRPSQNESTSRPTDREAMLRSDVDRATDPLFVPRRSALEGVASLEGEGDPYRAMLESICGVADDSQPVEQYDGTLGVTTAFVAAHQAPACQVQWNDNLASIYTNPGDVSGERWGSGTMISADLFLTCGHLFDQTGGGWERPRQNGTTNIISPQEIARNMKLNFNFQVDPNGVLRAEQSFPILELIEYRLGGLDMAICRIGGNPGSTFGRTRVSSTDAASPDMICIIGHPAGLPKRVEAGPTTSIDGNLIRYNDIDTLGGNSGSGILRASDGRLVGIHTNGGCNPQSPMGMGSNFGQRIAAVIAASPTLQALLRKLAAVDTTPRADLNVTVAAADLGGTGWVFDTNPRVDLGFTVPTADKRKFFDDVKAPVFDKPPFSDAKMPGFDNVFDPRGPFGQPGRFAADPTRFRRPFVLENPHHAAHWAGAEGGEASAKAELEMAMSQIEEAMRASEAQLAQLQAEYQVLLNEYQGLTDATEG